LERDNHVTAFRTTQNRDELAQFRENFADMADRMNALGIGRKLKQRAGFIR
jgi:hypothetical protein